ncbi:hypothetical protein BP6252_08376 [Coleophoma cylindrospora]|uniref:Uncharacterized protein n=1 Tax=Coleophoma cylindrospora TaxID=1849047 RepID=A0A3D8R5S6_9HELO|nr:hypothetical protein BP6252_08376 [Coleophoma cylindrospora]
MVAQEENMIATTEAPAPPNDDKMFAQEETVIATTEAPAPPNDDKMFAQEETMIATTEAPAPTPGTKLTARRRISTEPSARAAAKETFKFEKSKMGVLEQRKMNKYHLTQMAKYSEDFEILLKEMEDEAAEYIVHKGQDILLLMSTDEAGYVPKNIKEAAVQRFIHSVQRHLHYQFAAALANHLTLNGEVPP